MHTWLLLKLLSRPGRAGGNDLLPAYQRAFAATVLDNPDLPCLAFWRGRVALWSMLRALKVRESDEVVLSAYTCEMVPAAVKFAGARCVYVDVEPGRYNPAPPALAGAVSAKTRAVVCQHTYGITQPAGTVRGLLAGAGTPTLLEDCCQLISRENREGPVGLAGSASFFSTQWSKPFSTGLGGLAVFADASLYEATRAIHESLEHGDDRRRAKSLATQLLLHELTVRPSTQAMIAKMYRWAQKKGLVRGTTTAEEYGQAMPADYPRAGLNIQAALGMRQLRTWEDNIQQRCERTRFYLEHLAPMGVDLSPLRAGCDDPALWAVPLMVENKMELLEMAERAALPLATWFDTVPVHVAPETASRYDYQSGQCPRSERYFAREIHLLTSPSVTLKRAAGAMELLKKHARWAREDA